MISRIMRVPAFVVTILALCVAAPAGAQVVVNGGAPNEGAGWNIFDDNRAAATFSTSGPIAFDAIRFWGLLPDGPALSPTIYWQILSDDGGAPGTTVALEGNAPATSTLRKELDAFPGFFSWQFDFAVGPQTLGSGVFWLALHDGPLDVSGFTSSSLIWETTDAGEYGIQTFSIDDHWDVIPGAGLAFQLRGTPVIGSPEPSSIVLSATGVIMVGLVRRARRKRTGTKPARDAEYGYSQQESRQ